MSTLSCVLPRLGAVNFDSLPPGVRTSIAACVNPEPPTVPSPLALNALVVPWVLSSGQSEVSANMM